MNLEPLPQRILERPVLAAVRIPPLPDDDPQPNVCFVIVEATSVYAGPLYAVFRAWFDGDEWNPEYGDYDLSWPKAVARLAERVGPYSHRTWPASVTLKEETVNTTTPGLTGPLPDGWHRLTWRRRLYEPDSEPFFVATPDASSMVLARSSLEADPEVIPGSIKEESWS